jgi:nitrite reductase/ring-hydroxylating ferredoxin subunit
MADWPDRLNRFIDALQAGRRPERGLASTPEELEELRMAAGIFGSRDVHAEPDPTFLSDLRSRLPANRRTRERVTRAGLLRAAGLWAAGLASGIGVTIGVGALRAAYREPARKPAEIELQGGKWFAVGMLSDLAPGQVMPVQAGAVPAFLIREGGTVRAISRVCTHMGCLLNYTAKEQELACPCHGAWFNLDGTVDPAYGMSLPTLPAVGVRVDKGVVYVLGA